MIKNKSTKVTYRSSDGFARRFAPNGRVETFDGLFEFATTLPINLTAIAHQRLHWSKVRKVYQDQKTLVQSGLKCHIFDFKPPAEITLVRIAPRELDYDNLLTAFKHIRDVVADTLIPGLAKGRADGDKRLTWIYKQEKGEPKEYSVRIEVKRLD